MAPPEFADIGKDAKDLLSKDFNFGKIKIEAKTFTQSGVEFSSLLERASELDFKGEVKTKFSSNGLTFTDTYTTSNDLSLKVEATNLADGLKATFEGSFNPYDSGKDVKLGYSFKSSNLTTTGNVNALKKPTAKVDFVAGFEGINVGAQTSYDINKGSVSDYSAAVSYGEKDYSVAIHANKKFSEFAASYHHSVSSDVAIAASAGWKGGDKSFSVEFGTQYKIDRDATLKAKFNSSGLVGLGYIQKIRPDLKATFGLSVDTRKLEGGQHQIGYSFLFEPK